MKKLLLSFVAMSIAAVGMAQVSFICTNSVVGNNGSYTNTFADGADWSVPDMTDPANAILDSMVFVDDGTAADSVGCMAAINGADLNGQIAVVYRGDCQFGTKALNAQNAGAIGVIIINNAGAAVGMAGGDDGPAVTIPVVMISTGDGATLYDEILAGNTTVFIGNKFGFFENDMGLGQKDVQRAKQFATPQDFAQNDTEFDVNVGGWIYNFGQNDQTNVILTVDVSLGATSLYTESSAAVNMLSTDSLFISLPLFSQTTYPIGEYAITYTITSDVADDFIDDNSLNANFMITEKEIAVARIDATTKEPNANQHFQPATFSSSFNACIHFVDANASRRVASGVTFNATSVTGTSLVGQIIAAEAYIWSDLVTDINDPAYALTVLNNVTIGEYEYSNDDQDVAVSVLFDEPFLMEDNVHYLFCATSISQDVFLGYDNGIDYDENYVATGHISNATGVDGTFNGRGFGTDLATAITLNTEEPAWLGLEEDDESKVEVTAYPNPAVNELTIPLKDFNGVVQLSVVDVTGKTVLSETVNLNASALKLDVTNLPNGMYVFTLNQNNDKTTTFNVMITK